MIYFNKLFKIPGPADIGMSDSNNAMPSKMFGSRDGRPTWEEYYEHIKVEYPVRYFFASTVPVFFRNLWWKVSRKPKDLYYFVVSNLVPSRRYHMLDLRQPGEYSHGWCDTDHRMIYAMFNLLVEFVEKEMPTGYFVPSEEEAALDDGENMQYAGAKGQLAQHKEYMEIYNYWKVERKERDKRHDDALDAWSKAKEHLNDHSENVQVLWDELQKIDEENNVRLEDMLHRLISVRHCLWT